MKLLYPSILLSGLLLLPGVASAGWVVNSRGELEYRREGQVLGETSTNSIDEENAEELFNQLLDTAEGSPYSSLQTADEAALKQKFSELIKNIEIKTNALGEVEAVVTDPDTGIKSTSTIKDGQVVTQVVDKDGTVTTTSYDVPKDLVVPEEATTPAETASAPTLPETVELTAQAEGVGIETNSSGQPEVLSPVLEIEPHQEVNSIKLVSTQAGEMVFAQGRVGAKTTRTLSLDTTTNELIVETDRGQSRVAILPSAAVSSLLAANVIDETSQDQELDGLVKENLPQVESMIELTDSAEGVAYQISGSKREWMFGLLPVSIAKRVSVSAETGEVLQIDQSWSERLKDWVSF